MGFSAEWRIFGEFDVVLVLADDRVTEALSANPVVLHGFLTDLADLRLWKGDHVVQQRMMDPESWGQLIMARQETGEVIEIDPERFWSGVHLWFRSRGVDYDTPLGNPTRSRSLR